MRDAAERVSTLAPPSRRFAALDNPAEHALAAARRPPRLKSRAPPLHAGGAAAADDDDDAAAAGAAPAARAPSRGTVWISATRSENG